MVLESVGAERFEDCDRSVAQFRRVNSDRQRAPIYRYLSCRSVDRVLLGGEFVDVPRCCDHYFLPVTLRVRRELW